MSLIPKKICQSWKTKNLTGKLAENVKKLKEMNPEYDYELFDDEDCRKFLLKHFGQNYVNAFDILIPGAFKCDFWRYCYLYINGGVYLDIDMVPLVPLRELIDEDDKFISVVDRTVIGIIGVYQAFIACVPNHPINFYSQQIAFTNISTRRTGITDILCITGPCAMGTAVNLFLENKNTNQKILPGKYDNGLKFYKMDGYYTYDLNNRKIFKIKFEGYNGGGNYALVESYYKDDPRLTLKRVIFGVLLGILILCILGIVFTFIFRGKWKKCEESCSKGN